MLSGMSLGGGIAPPKTKTGIRGTPSRNAASISRRTGSDSFPSRLPAVCDPTHCGPMIANTMSLWASVLPMCERKSTPSGISSISRKTESRPKWETSRSKMRPVITPESSRRYEIAIRGTALSSTAESRPWSSDSSTVGCLVQINRNQQGKCVATHSTKGPPDPPPILDRVLLSGDDLERDLAVARFGEGGDRGFDLGFAAGDRRRGDQLLGHEAALLGLDEHQVAAVVFEVMRALRPEVPRRFDIGGDGVGERGRQWRHRREAAERLVGGAMQQHRRARAGLRHDALAIHRLARFEHGAAGQHDAVESVVRLAGVAPQPRHLVHAGRRAGDVAGGVDPAGAELGGQRPRAGAGRGDIERDGIARVDEAEFGVQQADEALLALDLGLDRLAAQQ